MNPRKGILPAICALVTVALMVANMRGLGASGGGFYEGWVLPLLDLKRMLWFIPLVVTLYLAVPKRHHKGLMLGVGCFISVYAILFSTRSVDWGAFGESFRAFRLLWLLPALLTFYTSMYLRAVRWGLLFQPHHDLKGYQVFRPLMICFAFNSILPGRVGEFVRAYVVGRERKTGMPTALATVVAERIFDGITLLALLAVSLALTPPLDPGLRQEWGGIELNVELLNKLAKGVMLGSVVLIVGIVVFLLPWTQRLIIHVIRRQSLTSDGLKSKLVGVLNQFERGFHALQRPAVLARVVLHSIVIWVLVGLSNMTVAMGFGLTMSLLQSVAIVTLIAIFILPPAAPGYWGLYEAGAIFSLLALGVTGSESLALAFALMTHLVQYVPIVLIGLLFAWQTHVRPVSQE